MKQKLLFAFVLIIASASSFAQSALQQKICVYSTYTNFSKYKLNTLLAEQSIPEIRLNRFGGGISYDLQFKDWLVCGLFGSAGGKQEEDNITTKSKLLMAELQVGHSIYKHSAVNVFAGLSFWSAQNTVSIFQEPKPAISLNNLLGAKDNLTIKNESYNAGIFTKAYFLPNSDFSPYVSLGYYLPIAKTKWKAEDTDIVDNVHENPFIFNITLGMSLWGFCSN